MTQNIYDNPEFFAGYSQLGRSVEGLDGAARWPRCARCCRTCMAGLSSTWDAALAGSAAGRARTARRGCWGSTCRKTCGPAREPILPTRRSPMRGRILERLDLPEASFDLAYSSLALHYVEHLEELFARVHRALKPGGLLVFSAEHPIYTAPTHPGWWSDGGHKTWRVDGYLVEGPRSTDWLAKGVIKQHRTIGTYLGLLLRLGFGLTHVEEWGPTEAQIAARPALAIERERPPFLLVADGVSPGRHLPCIVTVCDHGDLTQKDRPCPTRPRPRHTDARQAWPHHGGDQRPLLGWGIAAACAAQGAELAFTYQVEALGRRVRPLAASVGATDRLFMCDVGDEASLDSAFAALREHWDGLDFLVHAIAFADKTYLRGRYLDTPRAAFVQALDISCYSFVAVAQRAVPMMRPGGSLLTLSYVGAERWTPHYNVMGVAKAALEASVRYLAADLGGAGSG